jgi:hypothetical protein
MDLKPYYDKAIAAEAEVQRIAGEIDALIQEHDQSADEAVKAEKMQAALEQRPQLDAAKGKANQANELYLSMRNASEGAGVQPLFVPLNVDAGQSTAQPKSMTRQEFNALSDFKKLEFVKTGGKVTESIPEEVQQ